MRASTLLSAVSSVGECAPTSVARARAVPPPAVPPVSSARADEAATSSDETNQAASIRMVMYSPVVVAPSYSGIMAIASLSEVHAESRQQRGRRLAVRHHAELGLQLA